VRTVWQEVRAALVRTAADVLNDRGPNRAGHSNAKVPDGGGELRDGTVAETIAEHIEVTGTLIASPHRPRANSCRLMRRVAGYGTFGHFTARQSIRSSSTSST